jgi:nucleoside-diphosphate-sugar epimerase
MRILVTGSTGFVGRVVVRRLSRHAGWEVVAAVRSAPPAFPTYAVPFPINGLTAQQDWLPGLAGVDAVVHLAARVHVMHETTTDPLVEFRRVNVEGTLRLARQAVDVGVKRFVFVSSIKVNGEQTQPNAPYFADTVPAPADPYGMSKLEAEQALRQLATETGLEVVVIRPPLVYGPDVKANFFRMMTWLHRGYPLPFGAIHNQRSLVALPNLVDLIETCVRHPAAANQTFLVSDDEDLSTTDLLRRTANALGRPARLIPVPAPLMQSVLTLLGRKELTQRLLGSLQVDISHTRQRLSWTPPVRVDDALAEAAQAFLAKKAKT